eukprot:2524263-Amphidinium_carterae.2
MIHSNNCKGIGSKMAKEKPDVMQVAKCLTSNFTHTQNKMRKVTFGKLSCELPSDALGQVKIQLEPPWADHIEDATCSTIF